MQLVRQHQAALHKTKIDLKLWQMLNSINLTIQFTKDMGEKELFFQDNYIIKRSRVDIYWTCIYLKLIDTSRCLPF